jgi:alpha-tubulin suppressor-like RCC1 family protein
LVVDGIAGATTVSTGGDFGCALTSGGHVECWKQGRGKGTLGVEASPFTVERLADVTAISAGFFHVCALEAAGTIKCWGNNREAQLGNGDFGSSVPVSVPVAVRALR